MFRRSKSARSKSESASTLRKHADKAARSKSLPGWQHLLHRQPKGIMKFVSADESIHSVYGESKDGGSDNDSSKKGPIAFTDIEIREYARTVGDNPSCSAGPPIS